MMRSPAVVVRVLDARKPTGSQRPISITRPTHRGVLLVVVDVRPARRRGSCGSNRLIRAPAEYWWHEQPLTFRGAYHGREEKAAGLSGKRVNTSVRWETAWPFCDLVDGATIVVTDAARKHLGRRAPKGVFVSGSSGGTVSYDQPRGHITDTGVQTAAEDWARLPLDRHYLTRVK